ncbi:MAG: polysaccharide biosynthesis C-terminal domain-containing protein, partial [Lentisphaerae bacterium]|nr:polysaccharide biosynthesis C-terminal domain-containing protein [Lentisphaerota bacterium]
LLVFSLYKVFVPAFYALRDAATPVRVGVRVVGLNLALNLTFMLTWPLYYRHAGLAAATVLAGCVNAAALGLLLHRRIGSPGWGAIAAGAGRALAAAAVMGAAAAAVHRGLAAWTAAWPAPWGRMTAVCGAIATGAALYAALAARLCRPEMRELRAALKRRR